MCRLFIVVVFLWPLSSIALNLEVEGCGNLENAYGPFDYTNPNHIRNKLRIVEDAHFTPSIQLLIRKPGQNELMDDLNYTLRAFPNHHKALMTMVRYRLRHPWKFGDQFRSADCYFKRALAFKPDDPMLYLLYGIFKHKKKKYDEAEEYYLQALSSMKDNAELHYNLGLLYLDKNDIDKALKHAKKAYKLGFPLDGLKNKLKRKGVW